ncbi:nicotinamide N-methyltransferase-like [Gastrophryne carolinensis]
MLVRSPSLLLVILFTKMESRPIRYYHLHNFHSRGYIDDYFSNDSVFHEEAVIFPMEKLHQVFEKDHIQGDLCIDISTASFIHHLHSASNCFKEIILMRHSDSCIFELNRWLHDRTGAFCWNHTSSYVAEKRGERIAKILDLALGSQVEKIVRCCPNSGIKKKYYGYVPIQTHDLCEQIEMQLKNVIKHVVRCNFENENITHPLETPQCDCLITSWFLDNICNTPNDYLMNLRKMLKCVKPGGRLILIGVLNATYFINNKEKFHVLNYNKEFVCSTLQGEKLVIELCEVCPRKSKSNLSDFDGIIFISARTEK